MNKEQIFLDRGERLAKRLEDTASDIRTALAFDWAAMERTDEIISIVQGCLGGLALQTLVKRALQADKERYGDGRHKVTPG